MALVPFPSQNRDDENLPAKGGFSPFGEDEETPGEGRMTFLEHLDELRKRITHAVGGLLVGFIIAFAFINRVFDFVYQRLTASVPGGKLIYTEGPEMFMLWIKIAVLTGVMIASPYIMLQVWLFIAPGLYAKEKKALLPFLMLTPIFFGAGAAFAYFFAMPWALHFLLSFEGQVGGVHQEALPGVGNYLSFSTRFLFGFGVAFLLPILLMILERAGIVRLEQLTRSRRYAIVGAAVVSAVLTPPDVVSQLMLLVPLYALYELAILAIRVTHWRAARSAGAGQEDAEIEEPQTNEGPEAPPGGGRVGGSGPI